MSQVLHKLIIASGGKQADLARRLGLRRATVHGYIKRGYLPLRHAQKARLIDPTVTVEDVHREYRDYAANRAA